MTLYQIVGILKQIALTQPNVKSATDGSIYDVMNATNSVKYDVVHLSQTKHITDEETDTYGFNIFYVSRLEDSLEDNRLQIQSIGKEVLDNILRTFCENWNIDYPEIIFYPFTQKFADLCAGCYCRVEIEVPKEIICADDYLGEIIPSEKDIRLQDVSVTITENGTRVITPAAGFDGIGEITIITDVPGVGRLEDKDVEFDRNGEYTVRPDDGFDALASAIITVNVPSRYDEGYEDGETDQKAKLVATTLTANDTYTRADGWSAVTVNVPSDVNNQDYKYFAFDNNNTQIGQPFGDNKYYAYSSNVYEIIPDSGYTGLDEAMVGCMINITSLYNSGVTDGEEAQKAKMVATAITENGEYGRPDGYSAITVNVDDRYDEGYADGFAAGASACSSLFISAITLNVDSAITDSATATTTFSPLTAITDIYYTSSDPSIAIIDSGTGVITAVANGSVTICTKDRWTGLQDCKTVAVTRSSGCSTFWVVYNVTSTTQPTQILSTDSGAQLNYFSKMTYNGTDYSIRTGFTFPSTGLQRVDYTLANGYTRIGGKAFLNVEPIREAHFSNCISQTILGEFENSGLRNVQLNDGLQTIGNAAFWNCKLSSLTVPDSVKVIETESFQDCKSLTSVTIGSGVTQMALAFYHCSSLTRITIMATTPPTLAPSAGSDTIMTFDDTNNCPIYVPSASVNAYRNASTWVKYQNRIRAIS